MPVRRRNSHLRLVAGIEVGTPPHPRVAARLIEDLKRKRQIAKIETKEAILEIEEARTRLKAAGAQLNAAFTLINKVLKVGVSEDEIRRARSDAYVAMRTTEKEPA